MRRVASGIAIVLATSGFAFSPSVPAVAAGCSGQPGDVNGDGFAEVVVGEVGNHNNAGAVHVLYGSPSGVVTHRVGTALDDQYFTQATPGVPGTERAEDGFGSAAVFGDFDHDGCADLAIAANGENTITILYGSTHGITTTRARRFAVYGVLGPNANPQPRGAGDLAVADLDHDGTDDLALSASQTEVGGGSGGVLVLYGDRAGLNAGSTRPDLVTLATPGVPGSPKGYDGFGEHLVGGDFDGDGGAELAVSSDEAIQVLRRGPKGFAQPQPAPITPATPGFPGVRQDWFALGFALAAGDVNSDGRDDLAVGNPLYHCIECEGDSDGEGAVAVFLGSASGLSTAGSQVWTQDSPGVDDRASEMEGFGYAVAMGRLDDGPTEDLAIGAIGDTVGSVNAAGSVTVLLGSATGLTTAGVGGTRFHQDTASLAGRAEPGDDFGAALSVSQVQSRQRGSLIIGAPGEDVRGVEAAGLIHQLGTTPAGPTAVGSRTLDVTSPGVKGSAGPVDSFGSTVG